jgi:hypothetical protein
METVTNNGLAGSHLFEQLSKDSWELFYTILEENLLEGLSPKQKNLLNYPHRYPTGTHADQKMIFVSLIRRLIQDAYASEEKNLWALKAKFSLTPERIKVFASKKNADTFIEELKKIGKVWRKRKVATMRIVRNQLHLTFT